MRVLFVSLSMLIPLTAQADEMLLGEINFAGGHSGTWVRSPDTPLNFSFFASSSGGTSVTMAGEYTVDDVGTVVHATPEQVADFNVIFRDPNAQLHLLSVANPREVSLSGLWDLWAPFGNFTPHVPYLSGSFAGYTITDVTQTIEGIVFDGSETGCELSYCGIRWKGSGLQTIRIYGHLAGDYNDDGAVDAADYVVWRKSESEAVRYDQWLGNFGRAVESPLPNAAVPEPSSWLLALCCVLCRSSSRRRPVKIASLPGDRNAARIRHAVAVI